MFVAACCTVVVKPEFNIHAPAGVSLLCLVSSHSLTSSNAEYWWKKVLYSSILFYQSTDHILAHRMVD